MAIDLSKFSNAFDSHVRAQGASYFRQRRVRMLSLEPGREASFRIQDARLCSIYLQYDEFHQLMMTCTCQNYLSGMNCRHIWASILEANRHRFFDLSESSASLASQDIEAHRGSNTLLTPSPFLGQHGQSPWMTKLQKVANRTDVDPEGLNGLVPGSNPQIKTGLLSQEAPTREAYFGVDIELSRIHKKWALRIFSRTRKNSELGPLKTFALDHEQIFQFEKDSDRKILWTLMGISSALWADPLAARVQKRNYVFLEPDLMEMLVVELAAANQLYLVTPEWSLQALSLETRSFKMNLNLIEASDDFILQGHLVENPSQGVVTALSPIAIEKNFLFLSPYLLRGRTLTKTTLDGQGSWYEIFLKDSQVSIPKKDLENFLNFYFNSSMAPELTLPESIRIKNQNCFHKARLSIETSQSMRSLELRVQFMYGAKWVSQGENRNQIFDSSARILFDRNLAAEDIEIQKILKSCPFLSAPVQGGPLVFSEVHLEALITSAFALDWEVMAFRRQLSRSQNFKAHIQSGIDWFDLSAKFEFENGMSFELPQLLQHIKSGHKFVTLADGTSGLIRNEWIQKFGRMAQFGTFEGKQLRLTKIQALFFSAELSETQSFSSDKKFKTFHNLIEEMNALKPSLPGPNFKGRLRSYQKIGLSWLNMMSQHEIGTILADDMGLGKTIQVLACLSQQKSAKTLIVAPKSLVHNWIAEAEKFTPGLTAHNHTGTDRLVRLEKDKNVNLIVTTYHTLRLDIEVLKAMEFDFFILDEAHYIKNSASQAYMACRLIQSRVKLALTGTPVENSMSDLFSILSVVTPGLISDGLSSKYSRETDPEILKALSKSLKPFILRRTKDEVLKDLPTKTEQVLFCDLSTEERKKYVELKNFYWNKVAGKIEESGFAKSKFHILEALLRLRQASCHPALLGAGATKLTDPELDSDDEKSYSSSAKFDLLLEQLANVIADGHKALIFSQFTTLLGLLEPHLRVLNIEFEYLDGKTNDRSTRVKNFQENPNVKVFLISLKAGGVGLNLTSADYVFIMDPWWNPAAESQAIDRAHRIGQKKKVFAYKIIAKDTIEEKILALQERKRALAHAIVSSEKSLLKGLQLEDLRELFS